MNKITIPEALMKRYRLKNVTTDEAYFAELGHVKFSELTEYQAKWLVDNNSPHIEAIEEKETKTLTPKTEK